MTQLNNGKRSRSNSGHREDGEEDKVDGEEMMDDEETPAKVEPGSASANPFGLGFVGNIKAKNNGNDSDSSDSEYDNTVSTNFDLFLNFLLEL